MKNLAFVRLKMTFLKFKIAFFRHVDKKILKIVHIEMNNVVHCPKNEMHVF